MSTTTGAFLDIRKHGFVRVAAIVPEVTLSNPLQNAQNHLRYLRQAYEQGAMYAVCPELGLTGYSNGDLFFSHVLIEAALKALRFLLAESRSMDMVISVGMPLIVDEQLYNCAVTFCKGQILGITPKAYPPEYREFYEARHFARASNARSTTVEILGQLVPFGTDILIRCTQYPNLVIFTEICEDLWVPIPPSSHAALAGATVLANLSASNITIGKDEYRRQLVVASSGRNLAVQIYCATGFGESTADLAWDGAVCIASGGKLLKTNQRFLIGGSCTVTDVDLHQLMLNRRQSSFRQNGTDHARIFRTVEYHAPLGILNKSIFEKFIYPIEAFPFVPNNPADRDERCQETFNIQTSSLARRLKVFPTDRQKLILGLSGGQDSTHALLVAAYTMDLLGLPRTNIIALTMPGFGTTERTKGNAQKLAEALGVTFREISIVELTNVLLKSIGHDMSVRNSTYENSQAWARKFVELALAGDEGAMDLGTGDLSELALGWTTMFGDHASHYNPNPGVPKTLISHLMRWTAEHVFAKETAVQKVLLDILATPISPELQPAGADGQIVQKTEDINGPYELHDFFLYHFVRFGRSPLTIARLAMQAFQDRYTLAEIKKWLGVFLRKFFANQFKRDCLPNGPKVGLTSLSPRGDWRMPPEADSTIWLDDLAKIPDEL
ncbi:MAG: NAD(+) synthase [Patescibacteria group bacterium]